MSTDHKCCLCDKDLENVKTYITKFNAFDELNPEEKLSFEKVCMDCIKKGVKERNLTCKEIMEDMGLNWSEKEELEVVCTGSDKE